MGSTPTLDTCFNPFDKSLKAIYGPYMREYRSSGLRRQMVFVFNDGSKTSMSYARWLMTQQLQRRLKSDEHVDHIDENRLNDTLDNLQLLTPSANATKSGLSRPSPLKGAEKGWSHGTMYGWQKKKCDCPLCSAAKSRWNTKRNIARRARSSA